jgi:uncharacterized protein YdcH (DUF465 family)
MYVQTVQAGTPTTTPLDTYLANNVPPDATAKLAADGQEIHDTFAALPLPKAVSPEHLCATEEPVLVYQRDGIAMQADAYLSSTPADAPVPPVQPTAPVAPPKGCSPEQDATYKAEVEQYKKDLAQYQTAQTAYQQNNATYQTMLAQWKSLRDQVQAFNESLQSSSSAWSTSGASSTSSSPSDSIYQIAIDLDKLRKQRLSVKETLKALVLIDARIVALAKTASGDVTEETIAYAMAVRDLCTLLYETLLANVTEAESMQSAPLFAV